VTAVGVIVASLCVGCGFSKSSTDNPNLVFVLGNLQVLEKFHPGVSRPGFPIHPCLHIVARLIIVPGGPVRSESSNRAQGP